MNALQAKQIPLNEILSSLGHQPAKEIRGEVWYYSPFRQEEEPSFKITTGNTGQSVWYDFGEGKGGNVLDFIRHYYKTQSLSSALELIENLMGRYRPFPASSGIPKGAGQPFQVEKIQHLQNKALIHYLERRGIGVVTARPYVKEIYYTHNDKRYFALGFPNGSQGYELRNPYFKGCIGRKEISLLVKRKKGEGREGVTVFEGFFDFLSALAYYRVQEATTPVIVLNSVSMKDRAVEAIKPLFPSQVYLYLDRDSAGRQLVQYFKQKLWGIPIADKSDLYAGYKDFNEFLVQTRSLLA